jgi:prepilin-type N-terminal cleavage/methylation domain-containing protein
MRPSTLRPDAFTLVEILVVLSIMTIMALIAVPAMLGPTSSGRMNQNLLELSGLLEQGRQYALAQDTYVWVAFASGTDTTGVKTLTVAILASKTGIDPAGSQMWNSYSYGTAPSDQIELVNKIVTLRQIALSKAGTLDVSSLPATPTISGTSNSPAENDGGFFNITPPGTPSAQTLVEAVQFTPAGEARNGSTPIDVVDLDLQLQRGNNAVLDTHNTAVIRLSGLSGEPLIYRQ